MRMTRMAQRWVDVNIEAYRALENTLSASKIR